MSATARVWLVTAVAAVAAVIADLVVDDPVPGRIPALGFVGCALIILASKRLGKALLSRPESYYARPDTEDRLNVEHIHGVDPVAAAVTGEDEGTTSDQGPDRGPGQGRPRGG
jgi:hypothetical protein